MEFVFLIVGLYAVRRLGQIAEMRITTNYELLTDLRRDLGGLIAEVGRVLGEQADKTHALEERKVSVIENTAAPANTTPKQNPAMPNDIWMFCNSESEQWAREEAMKMAYEQLEELGSWDKVRERMSLNVGS